MNNDQPPSIFSFLIAALMIVVGTTVIIPIVMAIVAVWIGGI